MSNSASFVLKVVKNKKFLPPSKKKFSNLPGNPDEENCVKITLSIG